MNVCLSRMINLALLHALIFTNFVRSLFYGDIRIDQNQLILAIVM